MTQYAEKKKQQQPKPESVYESCRKWMETEGDVDDFIFYDSEYQISQR